METFWYAVLNFGLRPKASCFIRCNNNHRRNKHAISSQLTNLFHIFLHCTVYKTKLRTISRNDRDAIFIGGCKKPDQIHVVYIMATYDRIIAGALLQVVIP